MDQQLGEKTTLADRLRWGRVLIVWFAIAVAEIVHGTLRTLLLAPVVGDMRARQVGVFTGSLLIVTIAVLTIDWLGRLSTASLLRIGCVWTVLMILFEIGAGRFVAGFSWARIWSDFNLAAGGLLPLGM